MAVDELLDEHEQGERVRQWIRQNAIGIIGGIAIALAVVYAWGKWQDHLHGKRLEKADAYDAVYAVKAAMEACGKTPADADFTSAMVDAMYTITVDGLTGTMKWDATREPDKNAKAMVFAADGTTSLLG